MLKKIWCVPVATWFIPIATLAYRCSEVSSFTFVICFVSKVMPYFTSTVLFLLISDALIEFNLFDPSRCSVVTFYRLPVFGKHCHLKVHFATAAYEIPNWAKLWYRTVWNIINTGTFPVPVYRASLLCYTFKRNVFNFIVGPLYLYINILHFSWMYFTTIQRAMYNILPDLVQHLFTFICSPLSNFCLFFSQSLDFIKLCTHDFSRVTFATDH